METSLSVKTTPEVESLLAQASQLQIQVSEHQKTASKKNGLIFCPICQEGYLHFVERGKTFILFADVWLVCDECGAEFHKKFGKAALIRATKDPYGVFGEYSNRTLRLEEWGQIALRRIKNEIFEHEEQLSAIKEKLVRYVVSQFTGGNLNLITIDPSGFILKKGETTIFSTRAELIEERKRKVTQRTTVGGGRRNYGGFSFRVAKGLYYHTGSSSLASPRQTTVQSTEYTELVSADHGDFVITNQRVLFKGNRSRGLAIPTNKIAAIDVDPGEDALLIISENKKPSILKILNRYQMNFAGLEIAFSIDLDTLVALVKKTAI